MKIYIFNENNYELFEDYRNAFNEEMVKDKLTDYFISFDYVVGDISHDTLRLKGFYDSKNKNCREINDFANYKTYLKDYCSYDCKYFVLKKAV
jgi:uncharacterized protein YutD